MAETNVEESCFLERSSQTRGKRRLVTVSVGSRVSEGANEQNVE